MTDDELKRMIELIFLRSDLLWPFNAEEVSGITELAVRIYNEIKEENQ
jgi:hypothetical protein